MLSKKNGNHEGLLLFLREQKSPPRWKLSSFRGRNTKKAINIDTLEANTFIETCKEFINNNKDSYLFNMFPVGLLSVSKKLRKPEGRRNILQPENSLLF